LVWLVYVISSGVRLGWVKFVAVRFGWFKIAIRLLGVYWSAQGCLALEGWRMEGGLLLGSGLITAGGVLYGGKV
jgi:hypothetical protein